MKQTGAEEFWTGAFGDEYHERNAGADIDARADLWIKILECLDTWPESFLEIGAGTGGNLEALRRLNQPFRRRSSVLAVEPNAQARAMLKKAGFDAYDGTAQYPGQKAGLVFTSGVLIHIPPSQLFPACQGIYDAAKRYIVCIEYFSADPEEKTYRGHSGKLWKQDFGGFWLDNFDLEPLGCGFAWKRTTGLDNLTWWAFRKC